MNNYSRAAFINMGIGDIERYRTSVGKIPMETAGGSRSLRGAGGS